MDIVNNQEENIVYGDKQKRDKKDLLMLISGMISAILFVFISLWGGMKSGWTITFLLFIITFSIYGIKAGKHTDKYGLICLLLSILLSFNFITTNNEMVNFCSFIVMIITANIWLSELFGKTPENSDTGILSHFLNNTLGSVSFIPKSLKGLFLTEDGKKKTVKKIVIGLLIAFPILCIVIPLLMNADDAFQGLINNIFKFSFESITKIIIACFLTILLCNYAYSLRYNNKKATNTNSKKKTDTVILTTVTTVISMVYLAYMFSQLAYFFSAFKNILPEGYELTYAEYARNGFFEMCTISVINLLTVYFCIILSKESKKGLPLSLKITTSFISAFTLLLISTALSKMLMYINYYGMTELRICTSAFMLFLFVIFILLIIRCFNSKFNVLKYGLILACLILSILGLVNVNSFTAKYNFNAYKSGKLKDLDTDYLMEIGPEAVPYLIEAYKNADSTNKSITKDRLQNCILNLYDYDDKTNDDDTYEYIFKDKYYNAFYEMNIPLIKAYKCIDSLIKEDPTLCEYAYNDELKYNGNISSFLNGEWILDSEECAGDLYSYFGSGLRDAGAKIEFMPSESLTYEGEMSFYIGIGIGGDGYYTYYEDGKIDITYTDYNEENEHKLLLTYNEETERILMDFPENGIHLVWKKI